MTARKIELNRVAKVYSGIDGKCCCGCSGKLTDNDGSNDRTVKSIVKKLNEAIFFNEAHDEGDYAWTVIGKRLYVVYFRDLPVVVEPVTVPEELAWL